MALYHVYFHISVCDPLILKSIEESDTPEH